MFQERLRTISLHARLGAVVVVFTPDLALVRSSTRFLRVTDNTQPLNTCACSFSTACKAARGVENLSCATPFKFPPSAISVNSAPSHCALSSRAPSRRHIPEVQISQGSNGAGIWTFRTADELLRHWFLRGLRLCFLLVTFTLFVCPLYPSIPSTYCNALSANSLRDIFSKYSTRPRVCKSVDVTIAAYGRLDTKECGSAQAFQCLLHVIVQISKLVVNSTVEFTTSFDGGS